ncbi:hypothetical protein [Metaclostridioides mangenotii]|uniref:hypothetical protein n=1 Tax=Metaclostridioides mangenotii TaxID=1540 RepID=UPI0028E586E0|nr:hypothetical protein [Clostridioides mangenotii]
MSEIDLKPINGEDCYFHAKLKSIYTKGDDYFKEGYVPIVWYKGKYRIASHDGETIPYLETEEEALSEARKAFIRLAEREVEESQIHKRFDIKVNKNALTD